MVSGGGGGPKKLNNMSFPPTAILHLFCFVPQLCNAKFQFDS